MALRTELARRELAARGVDPTRTSWSVVPSFQGGAVPLPQAHRAAFVAHLIAAVDEAASRDPGPSPSTPVAARTPAPAEALAFEAGCRSCRGHCCRRGGTTAFITADTVRRVWSRHPDLTPATTTEYYTRFLPDTHLEGSCVFHTATGCTLPRASRSDSCNRYLCSDLDDTLRSWREPEGPSGTHYFAAISLEGGGVTGVASTEVPRGTPRKADRLDQIAHAHGRLTGHGNAGGIAPTPPGSAASNSRPTELGGSADPPGGG
ncbi:MAG: hypothetical protein HKN72_06040 [Gemmatimonadetes bacterium]|nr:hypothetical protein [Gemmatimonadota bacterium]